MSAPITCISSMATRLVLAELAAAWAQRSARPLVVTSVGGVDAARRVQAGERFDLVMLASDAIDRLLASGHLQAPRVDLVRSPVAVAVRAGAAQPDIGSADAVRTAVLGAASIGFSTGPSGTFLMQLFARWGIAEQVADRIVQAPPGVPVAKLVAEGEVALGFQQLSELLNVDGVQVLGTLPADAAFITTFAAARCAGAAPDADVQALLDFLAGPDAAEAKRRQGMEPA